MPVGQQRVVVKTYISRHQPGKVKGSVSRHVRYLGRDSASVDGQDGVFYDATREGIDKTFRDSITTFRRMTLAEIRQAKPHHLQVVTVAPGDTVEKLARRMAIHDRQVEHFRVLNGLAANARVKPGDMVKIVVE